MGISAVNTSLNVASAYLNHHDFIEMKEFAVGDWVEAGGEPLLVVAVESLAANEPVYNLETFGEHVYEAGWSRVLVHNTTPRTCSEFTAELERISKLPDAEKLAESSKLFKEQAEALDRIMFRTLGQDEQLRKLKKALTPNGGLGNLIKVTSPDPKADALARRLGGESRVKFSNGPENEYDAVSDLFVAQTKPADFVLNKRFRDQAKATFETAIQSGRTPYFHFEGTPHQDVLRKLAEYSKRFNIEAVIEISTLD